MFVLGHTGNPGSLVSSQTMTSRPLISILDADPELGAGLSGDARDLARRHAVAVVHALPTGPFASPIRRSIVKEYACCRIPVIFMMAGV